MAINVYIEGSNKGIVLGHKTKPESQLLMNLALDGTPYIQNPSEATDKRQVSIYCDTFAKRQAMDNASNIGKLISIYPIVNVNENNERVYGYIEKNIKWKEWKDGHGVGTFTMVVKERVVE